MPKISLKAIRERLAGWRGPLWVLGTVLGLILVVAGGTAVTSTNWYCARVCHGVLAETVDAWENSAHNQVSCASCHRSSVLDARGYASQTLQGIGEVWLTVTRSWTYPLNVGSGLSQDAERMPVERCTRCHAEFRVVTPSAGIIIDHDVHYENGIHCTVCHNRTGHQEADELTRVDPKGQLNSRHIDFMRMEGCFRCHSVSGQSQLGYEAPGACAACHPPGFDLVPVSHSEPGFYEPGGESSGHWKLKEEQPGYCGLCHNEQSFCVDCHGIEMPHPTDFVEAHGQAGKADFDVCARCHAKAETPGEAVDSEFCHACHHQGSDPSRAWMPQHPELVRAQGPQACFACHDPTYCARCHVRSSR